MSIGGSRVPDTEGWKDCRRMNEGENTAPLLYGIAHRRSRARYTTSRSRERRAVEDCRRVEGRRLEEDADRRKYADRRVEERRGRERDEECPRREHVRALDGRRGGERAAAGVRYGVGGGGAEREGVRRPARGEGKRLKRGIRRDVDEKVTHRSRHTI
ncbi:hypothetical protein KM043_002298 [Ampulex compressa]|nr:hypothetical protein KM043_002298 [Ampulex compressa]